MYPRLKEYAILRSWRNIDKFSVYDLTCDHLLLVDEADYEFLSLCDGTRTIRDIEGLVEPVNLVSPHVEWFRHKGILDILPVPTPLDKWNEPHDSEAFIRNVCWLITGSCNLTCKHCYMRAPENYWGKPLDWLYIEKMLDQFLECNVLSVVLTGGEPTSRPDFVKLLEVLNERKIRIRGINTNGTFLIQRGIIAAFSKLGYPVDVAFSLDGIEFHQEFRGNTNFSTVLEAIKESIRVGLRVSINTSVTKANVADVKQMYEFIKELGIGAWKLNFPNRIGRWGDRNTVVENSEHIPVEEEFNLYKFIFDHWISDGKPFELSLGNVFRTGKCSGNDPENEMADLYEPDSYVCNYYRDEVVVMPDGRLLGCNGADGNPRVFSCWQHLKRWLGRGLERCTYEKVQGFDCAKNS